MIATVNLFKAFEVSDKGKVGQPSDKLLERTIKHGFVFSPEVIGNYSEAQLLELVDKIGEQYGLSGEQMNSSFHKSWIKVRDASMEQLVMEQIIHYITTYGFERMGFYDEALVYIPNEELKVPLENGIELIVIRGYTKEELREKVMTLLTSGIALVKETLEDLYAVCVLIEMNMLDINKIRNREFKIFYYDRHGVVPGDPVEFLRYVLFKVTGDTLLIKSADVIKTIKEKMNISHTNLFLRYQDTYGLERLGEIFYRFKPLFLAFRTNPTMGKMVNRIRRLARKHHKPMKPDFLNEITARIKRGDPIAKERLREALANAPFFRQVRLAQALLFRMTPASSIVYQIRNGKGYATDFHFDGLRETVRVYDFVLDVIAEGLSEKVSGKKICIPENIHYAIPTSEKQFIGNFPFGTYVSIPDNMMVGVHWTDVKRHRIDLDLSVIDISGKIGWDASYRSMDRSILFSGDMTAAPKPKGASELFYIRKDIDDPLILFLNYYNYDEDIKVPYKLFVARERTDNMDMNYMVDPNHILASAPMTMTQKQGVLGLITKFGNELRFYFTSAIIGKSITSGGGKYTNKARDYYLHRYTNSIDLEFILKKAGASIVLDSIDADIDLSPQKLEKDTIIRLVLGV